MMCMVFPIRVCIHGIPGCAAQTSEHGRWIGEKILYARRHGRIRRGTGRSRSASAMALPQVTVSARP